MANNGGRFRHFCIVFYPTQKELFRKLHEYSERIAHYAFVVHDKDRYLDDLIDKDGNYVHRKGDIEKVHIQLIVSLYNGATVKAVARLFKTENDNAKVEAINDLVAQYRYLTHKDDPEKYQYSDEEIISDDINHYEKMCVRGDKRDTDEKAVEIVEAILAGINPRILLHRYGRDFAIHKKQYEECAESIRLWEMYDRANRVANLPPTLEEVEDEQVEIPFENE